MATVHSFCRLFAFGATLTGPRLVGPPLYLHGYMYLSAIIYLLATLLVLLVIPETKVSVRDGKINSNWNAIHKSRVLHNAMLLA